MNISGTWKGTIVYGKEYDNFHGQDLYFEMNIEQVGQKISGTAQDTGGGGARKETATFSGQVEGRQVAFSKYYPDLHYFHEDYEVVIEKSMEAPEIKYKGVIGETGETISGTWEIRMRAYLLGFIPYTQKSTGTWTMRRTLQNLRIRER